MTFQQLSYIAEVAKCGSINKAAHKLFLSQSGISTSIRELEMELNIQFFVRSNRGVRLTPEGQEFLSCAMSLLEQKRRLESMYGEERPLSAPVCFSVSTQRYPFCEVAFVRMLQKAGENRYRYSIRETGMDAVIDDVYDHRADVGIIFLTELTEKIICRLLDSRDLEFHEIASVLPCIYVRKGHPLAKPGQLSAEELKKYPYVSFEHVQGVASDFSEEYQLISLKKPSKCIQANTRSAVINILSQTDAFTTGSGLLVEDLASRSIMTIPIEGGSPIRLGWIRPKNDKPSAQISAFLELLEQSVAESIQFTEKLHQSVTAVQEDAPS